MTKAAKIELSLYRSGLLRAGVNAYHLETACKSIARHVARISRHQINACNGIQRWVNYAPGKGRLEASWTEADQAKADIEIADSRVAIREVIGQFITLGCRWDWKTDPRAGCVLRISDKANRRDCFI